MAQWVRNASYKNGSCSLEKWRSLTNQLSFNKKAWKITVSKRNQKKLIIKLEQWLYQTEAWVDKRLRRKNGWNHYKICKESARWNENDKS